MKQWEIWEFPFPSADNPHMFVILSPTRLCADANFDSINGLLCTTVRPPGRPAKPHEIFLDTADGLDWLTAVRCNIVFHFAKAAAGSTAARSARFAAAKSRAASTPRSNCRSRSARLSANLDDPASARGSSH